MPLYIVVVGQVPYLGERYHVRRATAVKPFDWLSAGFGQCRLCYPTHNS